MSVWIPPSDCNGLPRPAPSVQMVEKMTVRLRDEHFYLNAIRRRFLANPTIADWLLCRGQFFLPLPQRRLTAAEIAQGGKPDFERRFPRPKEPVGLAEVNGHAGLRTPADFARSFNIVVHGNDRDDFCHAPEQIANKKFPVLGDVGELYHYKGDYEGYAFGSIATKCSGHPLSHTAERLCLPGWRVMLTRRYAMCVTSENELQSIEVCMYKDGRCTTITRACPMMMNGRLYGISDVLFFNAPKPPAYQKILNSRIYRENGDIASEVLDIADAPTPTALNEDETSVAAILHLREATHCQRCIKKDYIYCDCQAEFQADYDRVIGNMRLDRLCPTVRKPTNMLDYFDIWKMYMIGSTHCVTDCRISTVVTIPFDFAGLKASRIIMTRIERSYRIMSINQDTSLYVQKELIGCGVAFPLGALCVSVAKACDNGGSPLKIELEDCAMGSPKSPSSATESGSEAEVLTWLRLGNSEEMTTNSASTAESLKSCQVSEVSDSSDDADGTEGRNVGRKSIEQERLKGQVTMQLAKNIHRTMIENRRDQRRIRDVSHRSRDAKGRFRRGGNGEGSTGSSFRTNIVPADVIPEFFCEEEVGQIIEDAFERGFPSRERSEFSRAILDSNDEQSLRQITPSPQHISKPGQDVCPHHDSQESSRAETEGEAGTESPPPIFFPSVSQRTCEICDHVFSRKSNMVRHKKTVHDGERKFNCDDCGYRFGHRADLTRHVRNFHDKRSYKCELCGFEFPTQERLAMHTRGTHSQVRKPFECEQCGQGFGRKSSLTRHISSVHKKKRWVCGVCDKTYSQKFDCEKHRRMEHILKEEMSEEEVKRRVALAHATDENVPCDSSQASM